jgi:hypothetical protein
MRRSCVLELARHRISATGAGDAMKRFKALLILAAVVLLPSASFGQAREQAIFSGCGLGTIKNKATLSSGVLKSLLATDQASEYFGSAKDDPKADLRGFFQAAEVHLADPGTMDLVVVGNPPLSGADNCWYWIVRSARKDPHVIFFGTGSSLEVMPGKTNGYRDIQTAGTGPTLPFTISTMRLIVCGSVCRNRI